MTTPIPSRDKTPAAAPVAPRDAARHFVTMAVVCIAGTLLLYIAVERGAYDALLAPESHHLDGDEAVLLPWTLWAKTLLFLLPALVVGGASAGLGSRRAGYALFVTGASLALSFVALDLQIYQAFGRHVRDVLRFAALPGGVQTAGNTGQWVWLVVRWLVLVSASTVAITWLARRWLERAAPKLSGAFWSALAALLAMTLLLGSLAPHAAAASWRHRAVFERLYGALPADVRIGRASGRRLSFDDPAWARLDAGLRRAYENAFPLLFGAKPRDRTPISVPGERPNVVLIVVESLREDAFTAERMPRVHDWASRGLRAKNHYAGSDYSESGMFLLLYGRSSLLYHSTLDAEVPPEVCDLAHRLGYECAYYSGHPKKWMRIEVFLNEHTMDRFVHDDHGDWPAWDRTALANLVAASRKPGARPAVSVVRLMSSHFEYQYPKEYERHLPVARNSKWGVTQFEALGADAELPHRNRYLNSVAFTDDIVADAIARLDAGKNIIVFTGDHGESIYDDGHYGHGYSFADVIARVPFAIVGPGIPAGTLDDLTLHADVLPTIAHAIGGNPDAPLRTHGRSLLVRDGPRRGTLLTHCSFSRDVADALLLDGNTRVRLELGLRAPEVVLRGFEDALGHATSRTLTLADADALVRTFERELDVLRR